MVQIKMTYKKDYGEFWFPPVLSHWVPVPQACFVKYLYYFLLFLFLGHPSKVSLCKYKQKYTFLNLIFPFLTPKVAYCFIPCVFHTVYTLKYQYWFFFNWCIILTVWLQMYHTNLTTPKVMDTWVISSHLNLSSMLDELRI